MPGSRFSSGRAELSYGSLAYHRAARNKPTLLFLHGLGDSGLCWTRTALDLADDYDVILLDARGHGDSSMPAPNAPYQPAADLAEFLDVLKLEHVGLVGHSIGALLAAQFAKDYATRVSTLVLEDPPLRSQPYQPTEEVVTAFAGQTDGFKKMPLSEVIAFGQAQHPTWDQSEFEDWARAKRQVDPHILASYQFPAWRELIGGLTVPTLLIHGAPGGDSMVSAERAQAIAQLNDHVQVQAIENAGHNVRRENFAAYMQALRTFLVGFSA